MSEINVSENCYVVREFHRGEVYYYSYGKNIEVGSEQSAGRPCIIVSNEQNNEHSSLVTIIPVTSKDKKPLPTHVSFDIEVVHGTALAEQVTTISKERLMTYCGEIDDKTQREIDKALQIQLGLAKIETSAVPAAQPQPVPIVKPIAAEKDDELLIKLKIAENEKNIYKELYNELLNKTLNGR